MSDVEAWLAAHEAEAVETLKAFCRIESVSTDPAYKPGILQAAEFVAAQLRDAGFPLVEVIATGGHPVVLAERELFLFGKVAGQKGPAGEVARQDFSGSYGYVME